MRGFSPAARRWRSPPTWRRSCRAPSRGRPSGAFFLLRAGVITVSIGLAYAWDIRPWARRWSPVQQLGRSSLFVYWIHVEMVYGLISLPLHRHLSHGEAWIGVGIFSLFMLLCSVAKDRVVAWWKDRVAEPPAPVLVAQ
jgi:fucose 4-O-acetylase-like acetyltransferase